MPIYHHQLFVYHDWNWTCYRSHRTYSGETRYISTLLWRSLQDSCQLMQWPSAGTYTLYLHITTNYLYIMSIRQYRYWTCLTYSGGTRYTFPLMEKPTRLMSTDTVIHSVVQFTIFNLYQIIGTWQFPSNYLNV